MTVVRKRGCLIQVMPDSWQVFCEEMPDSDCVRFAPAELLAQPEHIAAYLRDHALADAPVVLGLSRDMCLAVTVPVPSPQLLRKRTAMRYHLEEWIPWSAEDYVVDYVGHANKAFLVATTIEPLRAFLKALEELDVVIIAICPTALLVAAEYLSEIRELPDRCLLAWQNSDRFELLAIENRQPTEWISCATTPQELAREVQVLTSRLGETWPVFLLGNDSLVSEQLTQMGLEVQGQAYENPLMAARVFATKIIAGVVEPPLDLKRDELTGTHPTQKFGKQLGRLQLAAAALILLLTAGLWLRGNIYEQALADIEATLAEVYLGLFPGTEVPSNVRAAIDSEFRQLQATRSADSGLPGSNHADRVLQQVLAALPPDLRFRLPEIQIEGDRISLGGEVRANADADKIADSLRQAGFTVEAPKTQRLSEKGFSLRLSAKTSANLKPARQQR